jgi:bisphosphoglycerate-dependent phosphoglycerate mutase
MSETLPAVYLARHGETPWTVTGQHTGRTDLPLTQRGEGNAVRVVAAVQGRSSRQTQIENQTLRTGFRDKTEGTPSESIAQPVGVASGLLPHVSRSTL